MKKLLLLLAVCLTIQTASAGNGWCGGGGGYAYRGWQGGCGGGYAYAGYRGYGGCGGYPYGWGGGWVSYAPAYSAWNTAVVPVNVGPPTGIGISLFGLNILGINPTIPVAVPAQ